ncbi:MAG: glycosyltransferase family 39 protein [bacterium]
MALTPKINLSNRSANIVAVCLLVFLFLISISSLKDESLTMDELAHLPAGYSYLTQQDMRLNPEHPPLLKDLAAFPLLFIKDINFPSEIKAWQTDANGQWDFGRYFLYQAGNPAEKIIFWGRFPMILILILLGFYVFKWTRELFGNCAALLALFLFSFSPTLIAHGRLVTTDVGAAASIFIATYYFLKALKAPSKKNIVLAGAFFGIAQLCKFSAILLLPFFGLLGLTWWLTKSGTFKQTLKTGVLVLVIGFLLVWPVYQFHTLNYPPEKQVSDTQVYLKDTLKPFKSSIIWASNKPILRPYAFYATGLTMVFHRVAGGNTTYFLGQVNNVGWPSYFPIVYLIKIPLAFHILTLIALFYGLYWLMRKRSKNWFKPNFALFAALCFVAIYWTTSITGNLNIGVRHLLPVFPFTILLIGAGTAIFLRAPYLRLKYLALTVLIIGQAVSIINIYPHFIAYFNELIGGPSQGYKYVVDSNLDWGQDLKRLKDWADENVPTEKQIYIDYFGGGSPQYYFGNKYSPWWGERDPQEFPKGNYLAVSVGFLQGGVGKPAPGFNQPTGFYQWLNDYTPIAKIGYSIFVYYIE